MDIKYKIKLVDILDLEPYSFQYLDNLNLPTTTLEGLMEDKYDLLFQDLTAIIDNENENDQTRLIATCFRSKLLWGILNKADKDGVYCSENGDTQEEPYSNYYTYENKEILKKCKEIEKIPQEKINKQMFDFILCNYPEIENGFDVSIFSIGKKGYYQSIGIGEYWWYTQPVREKMQIASKVVQEELKTHINNLFVNNFSFWENEYKTWIIENGVKNTKENLKTFFSTRGKKVPGFIIDMLKAKIKASLI
ncbi:MAG: hypothetical protein IK117_06320 [Bacteroidales bacterium]|nr:hypothetical protein [Bacteroidales bacterium]